MHSSDSRTQRVTTFKILQNLRSKTKLKIENWAREHLKYMEIVLCK